MNFLSNFKARIKKSIRRMLYRRFWRAHGYEPSFDFSTDIRRLAEAQGQFTEENAILVINDIVRRTPCLMANIYTAYRREILARHLKKPGPYEILPNSMN